MQLPKQLAEGGSPAGGVPGWGVNGPLARLPDWAVPLPNGQLSSFDRMGRYADTVSTLAP